MFKIVFEYNNKVKGILEMLKEIKDELTLEVTDSGVFIQELDRSHITYIMLKIPKTFFKGKGFFLINKRDNKGKLVLYNKEKVTFDMECFNKILKLANEGDLVTLEKNDNEKSLTIVLEGDDKKIFKIPILDLHYEAPNPPELNLEEYNKVELPFDMFKEEIGAVYRFSDKGRFYLDNLWFAISAEPLNDFSITTKYLHGTSDIDMITKSTFNLYRIFDMLEAKLNDTIFLELGIDQPLRLSSSYKGVELMFLLAPRIESEE